MIYTRLTYNLNIYMSSAHLIKNYLEKIFNKKSATSELFNRIKFNLEKNYKK